jgi:hypothetical protein
MVNPLSFASACYFYAARLRLSVHPVFDRLAGGQVEVDGTAL